MWPFQATLRRLQVDPVLRASRKRSTPRKSGKKFRFLVGAGLLQSQDSIPVQVRSLAFWMKLRLLLPPPLLHVVPLTKFLPRILPIKHNMRRGMRFSTLNHVLAVPGRTKLDGFSLGQLAHVARDRVFAGGRLGSWAEIFLLR